MPEFVSTAIFSFVSSGLLVWLTRFWLSERLKQSIENEYKVNFEKLRSELEVTRLRTGFFFDHQRAAFSEILKCADELNRRWLYEGASEDRATISAPPIDGYRELVALGSRHRLFLDDDANFGFQVLVGWYEDAFDLAEGPDSNEIDTSVFYDYATFSVGRLAVVFQKIIGVSNDASALLDLTVLISVQRLNAIKLSGMVRDLPSHLKIVPHQPASAVVRLGSQNVNDLRAYLEETRLALAELNVLERYRSEFSAYLTMLDRSRKRD